MNKLKKVTSKDKTYWKNTYYFLVDNEIIIKVLAEDEVTAFSITQTQFPDKDILNVEYAGELVQRSDKGFTRNLMPKYN